MGSIWRAKVLKCFYTLGLIIGKDSVDDSHGEFLGIYVQCKILEISPPLSISNEVSMTKIFSRKKKNLNGFSKGFIDRFRRSQISNLLKNRLHDNSRLCRAIFSCKC